MKISKIYYDEKDKLLMNNFSIIEEMKPYDVKFAYSKLPELEETGTSTKISTEVPLSDVKVFKGENKFFTVKGYVSFDDSPQPRKSQELVPPLLRKEFVLLMTKRPSPSMHGKMHSSSSNPGIPT